MVQAALPAFKVIAGPCVIEDEDFVVYVAGELKRQLAGLPIEFYFKASYDKANRTSGDSFRGPGLEKGLRALDKVRSKHGVKLLTDFHSIDHADAVATVCDAMQLPAFLCRQTDLVLAGARAARRRGRKLNIKKGQFLAPWDAANIVAKAREIPPVQGIADDGDWLWLTERGASFGYNRLVVDMISFQEMKKTARVPVIYDATHSVQLPGAGPDGKSSGGSRQYIESLARAAVSAGADGVFLECHPDPATAKSDGPNAFYLEHVGAFIKQLLEIRALVARMPKLLPEARG